MTRLTTLFVILFWTGSAYATDISGSISTTLTITDDSKLVGDVTCTVSGLPCIAKLTGRGTTEWNFARWRPEAGWGVPGHGTRAS
jgi:hypothetical protein